MFTIEDLGITKEELQEKVIQQAVHQLLYSVSVDDEGHEHQRSSEMEREVKTLIKETIENGIRKYGDEVIVPKVDEMIRASILQPTNTWGEPKGEPIPMHEFMVQTCEKYLRDEVDAEGKSKGEQGYGSWSKAGTRINVLVSKHLNKEIQAGIAACMTNASSEFSKGIEGAAKAALADIAGKLKINVQTGR